MKRKQSREDNIRFLNKKLNYLRVEHRKLKGMRLHNHQFALHKELTKKIKLISKDIEYMMEYLDTSPDTKDEWNRELSFMYIKDLAFNKVKEAHSLLHRIW